VGDAAMSLINQVLNQLEHRGASRVDETSMVRAVPALKSSNKMIIWALGLFGLVTLLTIFFLLGQKNHSHVVTKDQPVTMPPPLKTAASAPILTEITSAPSVVHPPAVSSPVITEAVSALVSTETNNATVPFMQLSFALDTVILPTLPIKPEQVQHSSKPPKTVTTAKQPSSDVVSAPVLETSEPLPLKQVSNKQQAETTFRKAVLLMQQGRISDALAGYRAALSLDPGCDPARQALVSLLLENKNRVEAEQVLQEGLSNRPEQVSFAMMVARLQVERNAIGDALLTLEKSIPYAQEHGDYQAFFAALLQRQNRHQEALVHYQLAVQLMPNNGLWLMGEGISLQALQRNEEAKVVYKRALATQTLQADLQNFVQQKLKSIER
jgi:MSHA biogenesis protein MshN